MIEFLPCYLRTMGHEGHYSNNPRDKGGETYRGISRVYHPGLQLWAIIDGQKWRSEFPACLRESAILAHEVEKFYYREFWVELRCDQLPEQALAAEVFDQGVNLGVYDAALYLQAAINLLNKKGALWPDIPEDGILGGRTLATVQGACKKGWGRKLLLWLNVLQGAHYALGRKALQEALKKRSEYGETFIGGGWSDRVELTKT
jgi:lysozyme family protein